MACPYSELLFTRFRNSWIQEAPLKTTANKTKEEEASDSGREDHPNSHLDQTVRNL